MARRRENEEVDYLAGTQLPQDPDSFRQVVKEVYLLEHGAVQQQDIAEVLGVHKSRVSQVFTDVAKLKTSSIRILLQGLASMANRRRLFKAWTQEAFGAELAYAGTSRLAGEEVTEKTLR
ncbi:MAG: hypothetical protein K1X67_19705, partial [Fimbriimonadaceae bacterium]|nr:hypothetical protein [Fimbriimonadaceae bacterium]